MSKAIELEIVPGQSIGPFRLGMTSHEIKDVLQTLSPETPLTLEDLGITASCISPSGDWKNLGPCERCEQLEIRVSNNEHSIIVHGQRVNDIDKQDALRLFESFSVEVERFYSGCQAKDVGIGALRWEPADECIYSIFVMLPETRHS